MLRFLSSISVFVLMASLSPAYAQSAPQTGGTLVVIPASGEVRHPNNEAHATFMIEEQDKDKSAAASRVNQKTKQGVDIIKREDTQASLQTRGYYTYPVYADEQASPRPSSSTAKTRQLVGWRVGQYLEVTTTSLDRLPGTVAAAQRVLALNGLSFGLTNATSRKLEEQRIAAAYGNLTERIAAVAKAMGRNPSEAVLETVDFEVSGVYGEQAYMAKTMTMRAAPMDGAQVEEPSFEPGETRLNMRVVGKVRFK